MWRRILAIFIARNREFYRDTAGLAWNILMPIMMVLGFAFIFHGEPADSLKVGVVTADGELGGAPSPFLGLRHIRFVPLTDPAAGIAKVERHQLDLLLDLRAAPAYWVNINSANGYIAERLLQASYGTPSGAADEAPQRRPVTGEALRYADWVLPGILAMNVMFSSLWGVGWVVVRYRKNGVLRRLKATPLRPFEFLTAQVLSRLVVVLGASLIVYVGAEALLDFPMRGSYPALALVYTAGALCMISLGLIVAARLRTEELADGILNLVSWPMLLLSGVWFSLDGASPAAQAVSQLLPLTHLVEAARRIMIDGAGVLEVLPEVALLAGLALALLALAARLFRWE
ncbi:ABC transporter permease [Thiococcus pfennigii]|jgi:ABC-type multidrug transport system permease subunit|uniref:ABC transporter permease n=1 Tax=Thiococcus pfennigii TaxID=1057 RepID=UPI0019046E13|nr:ABC transporter permease [Thiococcus pfennigii]MBK1699690.1 ABC transporter permease [Thiococcus pfennigii]MBK1731539.1 ABC transporter permease [Thiococcus pfennigii]